MADDLPPATEIIGTLALQRHPEGGWYRQTWRGPPGAQGRSIGTAIVYLLAAGERSHWHRVDAAEHWIYNSGDPIEVLLSADGASIERHILGPQVWDGAQPHVLVPPGVWQAACPLGRWTLVTCTVCPGFEFAGFELAPPDWSPGSA